MNDSPSPLRLVMPGPRTVLIATVALLLTAFAGCLWLLTPDTPGRELTLSQLGTLVAEDELAEATFLDEDARVVATTSKGHGEEQVWASYPSSDSATGALLQEMREHEVEVSVDGQPVQRSVRLVATGLLPLLILAALFGLFFVGGDRGQSEIRGFGTLGRRNGGRTAPPAVTFGEVAGADEAVQELREVVDHLGNPGRYAALGASAPKGVLLFGPPGTGKTLIARATAGEAGVPFFSVSGAEFVESLVGVGAARIRDLFTQVRAAAPAILFIDELDAAGRKRGGNDLGGAGEREQTLNQLLVEMDGFASSTGVVVMAATNRPDILDPALLRPGRFDRHVTVDRPDLVGRRQILEVHVRTKPLADDVDLEAVARRTPGFTGAELGNVVNEAALLTIRAGQGQIGMTHLVEAIDRVLGGPHRTGALLSDDVRRRVAAHEAGHAVVARSLGREVHRLSVVARANTLGAATASAREDSPIRTAPDLADDIALHLSGRAAEELLHGCASTGSEADLERATAIAHDMVLRHGLSPAVGRRRLVGAVADAYLDGSAGSQDMSEQLRRTVEAEVRLLLDTAFDRCLELLEIHRAVLDDLVDEVTRTEVIDGPDLELRLEAIVPGPLPVAT